MADDQPLDPKRSQMVYFTVENRYFAVDTAELAGVATGCPYAVYPGLPPGVCGIVQWSGKIFPILDTYVGKAGGNSGLKSCTFLFSSSESGDGESEFALAVPGQVRVLIIEEIDALKKSDAEPGAIARVRDKTGIEAVQIRIVDLIKVPAGRKRAA